MKKTQLICVALLFSISSWLSAAPAKVTHLLFDNKTNVTLNFQLTQKTQHHVFLLKNPHRLVVDLTNAKNGVALDQTIFADSPIQNVRLSTKKDHHVRYVFDLNSPIRIVKTDFASIKTGYQLSIRLANMASAADKTVNAIPAPPTKTSSIKTSNQKLRDIVIVIDPGHGGHDPGATGLLRTHEKNITLSIGLKLRDDLQDLPGIKVYMTRTRDIYPSLGQRLSLARRVNADIYISIHADAYRNRAAQGATIFALSQGRATSEAGRWLAERENRSELLGGVELSDKSYMLRSVLVDLSQTATIGSSLKLGTAILNSIRPFAKLHSRKVEQASLYVLTSPDIPAILVETGFISNRNEEQLLRSLAYQAKLALAIKTGIEYYLWQNPIPSTIFSAKVSGIQYIAKSSDTIASIAAKYNVSLSSLKNINLFQNNSVSAGQVVRIPAQNNA